MSGPPPAVAATRRAVRGALADVPAGGLVLAACSGGADSLALAAALAFEAPRAGIRAGLLTVDHGLQTGSAERATKLTMWASERGFDPVRTLPVRVTGTGGPEAAARDARYAALSAAASGYSAAAVLLGHTRDDQAETVFLALARGAGPRGISGMPYRRGVYLRPFLDLPRSTVRAAGTGLGLDPWDDPHNSDGRYARARVRDLVAVLGEGVVGNLARTAAMVAADNEVLDWQAAAALDGARDATGLSVAVLAEQAPAIRTRVLHRWARELGVPGSALSHRHVAALDALVTGWRGQGPTYLPGRLAVGRRGGRLVPIIDAEVPGR